MHTHLPPVPVPAVRWPVWVGSAPRLAAAFQPRSEVREAAEVARSQGSEVVLSGDGGVGKSQLAASLARELRDQERSEGVGLDVLVWAKATEPDQIITAYAEAAEQLMLPSGSSDDRDAAARGFLRWLATTECRWLVVLDDITDPESVEEWWPDSGARNGWVLATTRRDDALLSGQGRTLVRLGLYGPQEARAYLRRRLTDAGHPQLYESERAGGLAEELGHLPLALGHAAAYLINTRRTMTDYLTLLSDTRNGLGDLLPPSADAEGYGRPVTTALLISLSAVDAADTTRLARPLLQLAALMDPLGHPAALWTTAPALDHLRTTRPAQRRRLRRHRPAVTEAEVRSALECLRTYALVTQDTATAPVRMHALTARAVRETVPPGALAPTARIAADAIQSLWPARDHEDWELSAVLRANTIRLDHHTRPALWQPTTHESTYRVSISLSEAGLYQQAVEYDLDIVRHSTDVHGAGHSSTLAARNNLAASYREAGHIQEALELSEQVLADRERILNPDHPDTLTTRSNLAVSYRDAGRIQEALELGEQVLADRERILDPDHPETLSARNNLANLYREAGRNDEALELSEQVLADRERILDPDHPDTLNARSNLAVSYRTAGRIQEALELSEQVLADRERILNLDHPDTLNARSNLANLYREAGRNDEALELREQVLADRERILDPDHPDTLNARSNLAVSYRTAGRIQEALELREQVLADRERILNPDHPDTLNARNDLAISYRDAGRIQEAIELSEQVLGGYERLLGPDHAYTLDARESLALYREAATRVERPDTTNGAPTRRPPPASPPQPA